MLNNNASPRLKCEEEAGIRNHKICFQKLYTISHIIPPLLGESARSSNLCVCERERERERVWGCGVSMLSHSMVRNKSHSTTGSDEKCYRSTREVILQHRLICPMALAFHSPFLSISLTLFKYLYAPAPRLHPCDLRMRKL